MVPQHMPARASAEVVTKGPREGFVRSVAKFQGSEEMFGAPSASLYAASLNRLCLEIPHDGPSAGRAKCIGKMGPRYVACRCDGVQGRCWPEAAL